MNFLGMGPLELVVILALALIVFGPDKLPEIAQQVGRAVREVRRMSSEVTDELQKSIETERRPTVRPPSDAIAHQPPPRPIAPPPNPPASTSESDVEPPY